MSSTQRTRRLCWSTEKCTCRGYCRRSRHDGAATRSRKGVGVYSTLSHSLRTLHQSVPWSPQQQQQRAGALTLSSSCLDGSVTPVGPGQNPQYTGAPKAGGGCGLLDKSQPRAQWLSHSAARNSASMSTFFHFSFVYVNVSEKLYVFVFVYVFLYLYMYMYMYLY